MAILQQKLSEILDKKVDLTTPDALNKAMKDRIIKETLRAA
jgi:predicted nucleotidyltransferase